MTLPKRLFRHIRMFRGTHVLPLMLWPMLASYLYLIPPGEILVFAGFYLLLGIAVFCTLCFLLSLLQSSAIAFAVVGYLVVRQLHLDNSTNLELLLAIAVIGLYTEKTTRLIKKKYLERKNKPVAAIPSPSQEPKKTQRIPQSLVRSFPVDFLRD